MIIFLLFSSNCDFLQQDYVSCL